MDLDASVPASLLVGYAGSEETGAIGSEEKRYVSSAVRIEREKEGPKEAKPSAMQRARSIQRVGKVSVTIHLPTL